MDIKKGWHQRAWASFNAVESLLKDTLKWGHLVNQDTLRSPNFM